MVLRVHYISLRSTIVVVLKALQLIKNLMGVKILINWLLKMWSVMTGFSLTNFDINFDTHH